MTTTKPDTYTLTLSATGAETIKEMCEHVQKLGRAYGYDSKRFHDANESFLNAVAYLFGYPMSANMSYSRDGDLSLFANAGFMVFGCIFHREHRACEDPECKALIRDDGSVTSFSGRRAEGGGLEGVKDHEHTLSYPLDAPTPGTWSFHS